jgi:AcrR family transcriptional regulator
MPMEEPLVEADNSTRQRILAATAEVLGRNGMTKLSLSEVALQAGVSRPTLYRWFASKRDLLDAFVVWERQYYERAVAEATADLPVSEKLDAALRVIVDYQQSYPGLRMVDIEPEHVIRRLSRVIPLMRERLERLAQGPDASLAVSTAVRVAISHYLVRSDDGGEFLAQLRHATRTRGRAQ